jgi:hypothetical protein
VDQDTITVDELRARLASAESALEAATERAAKLEAALRSIADDEMWPYHGDQMQEAARAALGRDAE